MSLLLIEGFESGATLDSRCSFVSAVGGGTNPAVSGYTGNAFRCIGYSSGVGNVTFALGSDAHATVAMGCHIALESTSATSGNGLIYFKESGTQHVAIGFDATGHATVYGGAGTLLATSAVSHTLNSWFHIEVLVVVHDTAGSVTVKIGGITEIALTGIDTRNGATGVVNQVIIDGTVNSNSYGFTVDDMWVTNGVGSAPYNGSLGELFVENLYPNGNGASSQWVNSAGNSTSNWSYVDDASGTDYVQSGTSGDTDLYALQDGTTSLGTVVATQAMVLAAKSGSGAPNGDLKVIQRSTGGVTTEEVLVALGSISTTFTQYQGAMKTVDPNGDAWNDTRLAGLQTGVKVA